MKINLKARNLEITPAINDYVEKRLCHAEKFIGREADSAVLEVEIEKTSNHHKEGEIFAVEVKTHLSHRDVYAKSEREDLYQAIDAVENDLVRILEEGKAKRLSLVRRGHAKIKNMIKGFGWIK
jgi:putative sigma-54 modulation protein